MPGYTREEICRIALQSAESLTWRQQESLLRACDSAENALNSLQALRGMVSDKAISELKRVRKEGAKALLDRLDALDARVVFPEGAGYPALLGAIPDAPHALFLRGAPAADKKSVAIVGTRRETRYGRAQAFAIARGLAEAGVTVVSGLARGIDTAAHEGALAGGGRTVAVLASGIDRVYPEENADLAKRILENGGAIMTEFPPGTEPLSFRFPIRNRIISGMSAATLLIEGHEKSGALITAGYAAEQGREVFALPGAVDAPGSAAPLKLLREGARIATCAADILEDMGWGSPRSEALPDMEALARKLLSLSDAQRRIASLLTREPRRFEELAEESGLSPDALTAELSLMELDGVIEPRAGRVYALKRDQTV